MRVLNLNENSNKKADNVIFTHIRKAGYPISEDEIVQIKINDKPHCYAKVIRSIYCEFHEINPLILMLDCGKDEADTYSYFKWLGLDTNNKDDKAQLYVLMRTDAPAPDSLLYKLL
jgi:hypothetical protein